MKNTNNLQVNKITNLNLYTKLPEIQDNNIFQHKKEESSNREVLYDNFIPPTRNFTSLKSLYIR